MFVRLFICKGVGYLYIPSFNDTINPKCHLTDIKEKLT